MWTPESALSLAAGLALAAAAGLRVFAPLLVLSLAARAGWIPLAPGFEWIASTPATIAFGTATVAEVIAYYVPFFDNALDWLAAPVAITAGAIAGASLLTDLPPWLRYSVGLVGGGGVAGLVHSSTALLRLKSSATTLGHGNFILATLELAAAVGVSVVSLLFPVLAVLTVTILLILIVWMVARRSVRRRHAAALQDS